MTERGLIKESNNQEKDLSIKDAKKGECFLKIEGSYIMKQEEGREIFEKLCNARKAKSMTVIITHHEVKHDKKQTRKTIQ